MSHRSPIRHRPIHRANRPTPAVAFASALVLAVLCLAPGCADATGDTGAAGAAAEEGADPVPGGETSPRRAPGGTAAWDRVLEAHAAGGGIDYAGVQADRSDLDRFLAHVARTDPATLSEDERLAFLSNAYNAYVVAAVLERYPGIRSVREVDGFFDEETHRVGGEAMTLDAIEAAAREIDARVHFAVVCASTSCPDLRGEAYTGARIDQQLEDQTRRFLADESKGLRYDAEKNELWLSSIFKWYAHDFTGGSRIVAFFARGGIADWVIEHVGDDALAATLKRNEPAVEYMEYDWSLNDR